MAKKRTAKQDKANFQREKVNFYHGVGKKPSGDKFNKMIDHLVFFEKPGAMVGKHAMEKNISVALKQLGKALPQAESKALFAVMSASYVSGKFGHLKEFNKAEYILNELNAKARKEGWTITEAKTAVKSALSELTNYKKMDYYNVELAKKLADVKDITKLSKKEIEKMQIRAKLAADESYMLSHSREKLKTMTTLQQLRELYTDSEIEMFEERGWLIINEDGTIEWT